MKTNFLEKIAMLIRREPQIDEAELARIEEMAERERREEGSYPPDDVR